MEAPPVRKCTFWHLGSNQPKETAYFANCADAQAWFVVQLSRYQDQIADVVDESDWWRVGVQIKATVPRGWEEAFVAAVNHYRPNQMPISSNA